MCSSVAPVESATHRISREQGARHEQALEGGVVGLRGVGQVHQLRHAVRVQVEVPYQRLQLRHLTARDVACQSPRWALAAGFVHAL